MSHPCASPDAGLENLPWFAAKFATSACVIFQGRSVEKEETLYCKIVADASGAAVLVTLLLVSRALPQPSRTSSSCKADVELLTGS